VRQSDGRASLALDKGVSAVYSGFAGNKGSADVNFTQPVRTAFYAESNETAAGDGRSVAGSFNADTVRTMNDAVIKEVRDNPVIRHALFMDKGIFAPKVGFNSSGRGTSDATTDAGEADVIPMESGNKKVLDYDALVKKFSGSQADDSRYKGRPEGLEQSIQKETEKTVPGSVLRDRAVHQVTSDDEGKQKAANVNSPADFKIASIKEKNAASLASKQVSYTDKGILAPQRDLAEGREGLSDGVDNASQSDEVSNHGVPGQTENSSAPDGVVRDVSGSGRKFGEANVNVRQGGAAGSQRQVSDGELYADLTVENDSAKARVDISRQEDRIYSGVKIPVFGDGRNNQATSVAGTAYVAAAGVRGAVQQTNLQQEKNFTANDLLTDGNNGLFEAGDAHVDLRKRVVSAEGANIMVKIQRGGSGFSVDEHAGKSSTNGIAEISSQNPEGQASRMNDSPSVDDGNVVEQVLSQLPENAFKGATRVRINLQPESLGKVDMDIVVRENSVRIFIVADRSEVVQALQGQQEQLKNALQSQGLQIGNLDFHLRDNPNLMDDGSRGGEMLRQQQQGGRQRESRHYVEPVIPETSGRLAAIRNMQSAERTVSIFV
jgi:flagellar hook-length control protein FliK